MTDLDLRHREEQLCEIQSEETLDVVQKYGQIFNNLQDGVCIFDRFGEVVYVNQSAVDIFDSGSVQNSVGKSVWDIVPIHAQNKGFTTLFRAAIKEPELTHEEMIDYKRHDGTELKLRVCTSFQSHSRDFAQEAIIALMTDLTEIIRVYSAFSRYTSADIARTVLNHPDGEKLGGQLMDVTIVMSDLRGFTAFSANVGAENLVLAINNYFKAMSGVIEKYKGSILEFLGDGIFTVFGAPITYPDHAERAVACALEMQNVMDDVNEWNRSMGFPEMEMGIGINSGKAVVGNIGSDSTMKYQCMGEEVNLAGRIEGYTIGKQILISEKTKEQIHGRLHIVGEQSILPKGSPVSLKIYDVVGIEGEYTVTENKTNEKLKTLDEAIPLAFFRMDGKTVEEQEYACELTALSKHNGIIKTEQCLNISENIMMKHHDESYGTFYARIMKETQGGYHIRFTARTHGLISVLKEESMI